MNRIGKRLLDVLTELWRGATEETVFSRIAALVFAVLELVACSIFFSVPRLAKLDYRWILASSSDEYGKLAIKLIHYRRSTPKNLQIVYLGASQAQRALATVNGSTLGKEVSKKAGVPVTFNLFGADNERYEEMLGITDQLPKTYRGIVVLTVTDYKDDYTRWKKKNELTHIRKRIPFVSAPSLTPIWRASGYKPLHTGIFFIDNLDFFAARRSAGIRFMPVEHYSHKQTADDGQKFILAEKQLNEAREKKEQEAEQGIASKTERAPLLRSSRRVLGTLLKNMLKRHIKVVLIEAPTLPIRDEIYAKKLAKFRKDLADVARRYHAENWRFDDQLDLHDTDFRDKLHLKSPEKRRIYEGLLTDALAKVIRRQFSKDVDPDSMDEAPVDDAHDVEPDSDEGP